MLVLKRIIHSSLGLKYIMAITGMALLGFVVVHLAGQLLIYGGPEAINQYAASLHAMGNLLWVLRGGLLAMFVLHISVALILTKRNRAARPQSYACKKYEKASFASRTMLYSGLFILFYVCFHLAHFTFGTVADIAGFQDAAGRHDVYKMMVLGFQDPRAAGFYLAAMVVLGLHLSHGISSMFQSLGLNHPLYSPLIAKLGPILGWGMALSYMTVPLAVLTGIVALPAQ